MIRAYCYASGLIEFGRAIPKGAVVIARGPEKDLRDFIAAKARVARLSPKSREELLVPGMPEADSTVAAREAFARWTKWISTGAPKGVRVLPS